MLLTWGIISIITGVIYGQSTLTNPAGCTYSFEGICSAEEIKQEQVALRQQVRLLEETLQNVSNTQQLNLQLVHANFENLRNELEQVKNELIQVKNELNQVKQDAKRQLENVTEILQQTANSGEECGCKEELRWLNSTGIANFSEILTKQTVFQNLVTRQLEQLNISANECRCHQELDMLSATLTKIVKHTSFAKDCAELKQTGLNHSGVYTITPNDNEGYQFDVYCDMETDGGGWTVFQRRQDGSVYFNKVWHYYKDGFGDLNGEFWLGNQKLHRLTAINNYTLHVDLEDWDGVKANATYLEFNIANEADKYRLTFGNYSGNAGDSLDFQKGGQFATKDEDSEFRCAHYNKGGWWYNKCQHCNLNGYYYQGGARTYDGVRWRLFRDQYSLKRTEMKIRPTGFKP